MSDATRLVLLKATTANRTSYTPLKGEALYDTDLNQLYVGDGTTAGGNAIGATLTNEQVQDIVGSLIGDSSTIDVTYDDSGNVLTMDVIPSAINTSDLTNDAGFETPTQLNSRDTNNRNRSNHTGTQLASTISNFAATVLGTLLTGISFVTSTPVVATDSILVAIGKLQAQINNMSGGIFGSEFQYEFFTNVVSFNTSTLFQVYEMETDSAIPPGKYRIMIHYGYEPGSTSNNDHSEIRVNNSTANLEQISFEDEGKDTNSDIKRTKVLLGYYTKTTTSIIDVELWARNESGTTVIKGATIELWRVS